MTPHEIAHLTVSDHAARRFVERRGAPGVERARADLLAMAAEGKEVHPPHGWLRKKDLAHPRKGQVTYIRSGGWLLVVEEYQGPGSISLVVKTVFVPSPEECWWW